MSTKHQALQPSNNNPRPNPPLTTQSFTYSLQTLLHTLLQAHQQAFPSIPSSHSTNPIAIEFRKVQQQIIEVVEMRKDMQKMLELQALQSTHFDSVATLIRNNLELQALADQSATTIKHLQSQQIEKSLQIYSDHINLNSKRQNMQESLEVKCLVKDMKRQLSRLPIIGPGPSSIQTDQKLSQNSYELTQRGDKQVHFSGKNDHLDRDALNRQIYRQLFMDLSLRQQLLVERQSVFQDYQASSHELVEALLRQRQKQSNLQRAQHEKHQQLLGTRHRFDIELQKLTHHQSHLVSLYQFDLINLKKHLHQAQGQLKQSQHQANLLQQQLITSQQQAKALNHQLQSKDQLIIGLNDSLQTAHNKIQELSLKLTTLEDQLKSKISSGQNITNNIISLQELVSSLQRSIGKLQEEKIGIITKNEELQSQLNEAILRSSQGKKIKQQLNKKLEETQRQIVDQKQKQSEMKLAYQRQQSILRQQLNEQMKKSEMLEKHIRQLQMHIIQFKSQRSEMQSKLNYLENQLTTTFIEHNKERKQLAYQLEQKEKSIALCKQNNLLLQQEIDKLRGGQLSIQDVTELKRQLSLQIQRQMQSATRAVDQFAQRIHAYCLADS